MVAVRPLSLLAKPLQMPAGKRSEDIRYRTTRPTSVIRDLNSIALVLNCKFILDYDPG